MLNLIELFKGKSNRQISGMVRSSEMKKAVIEQTSFLPENATVSQRLWHIINNSMHTEVCPRCGKASRKFHNLKSGYFPTCGSLECRKIGRALGNKKKRDWKSVQDKMKKTYSEKTGYAHNTLNPESCEKRKETCQKRYGKSCPCQTEKALAARQKAVNIKYGSSAAMLKESILKRYGSWENFCRATSEKRSESILKSKSEKIKKRLDDLDMDIISMDQSTVQIRCRKCGTEFSVSRQSVNIRYVQQKRFCPKCNYKELTYRSNEERELYDYICSIYSGCVQSNKKIGKWEVDVLVPDKKIAVDFNGVYWHSEMYKGKYTHQAKKIDIENAGYIFIQIWEDDWNSSVKRKIIKSRLSVKLGLIENRVYARKCEVRHLSSEESIAFLEENHLQGSRGGTIRLGLFYKNELELCAVVGKSRMVKGKIELVRLCTKKGTVVVGGFSKLLSELRKHIDMDMLMSYADCDWCSLNDSGYVKSGFIQTGITEPDYSWEKNGLRENRMKFMKHKLVAQGFDPSKTEIEIMHEQGYVRVFGSGNILFKFAK